MATRQKESEKRGVSPMAGGASSSSGSSSTHTERRRSLRPSTPPGTAVAKDPGKAPAATSSTTGEPRKHVPNYLKPTISSNPDAAKHKQAHDDTHKPTPTMMRRRSFDRPVSASQVQRAVQSSSARGERSAAAPFSPKHSAAATRPASERISKIVKAVKSQPPLLKTKSLPKASSSSGVNKEVKTSNLKKVVTSKEEEPVYAPSTVESEAKYQESLDLNVEEELAKMESPVDLPPEKYFAEDKEHIDQENHIPKENADATEEKLDSSDIIISEDHQDAHEQTTEPVAENTGNVEVSTQVVHESQHTDDSDQQSNQAVNEAPAEHDTKEEEEIETETEEERKTETEEERKTEIEEEIKPVGLTVKTTSDEKDEVAEEEDQGQRNLDKDDETQKSQGDDKKEEERTTNEEEKPANSEAENVVHKRQVGGPRNKKESPAYNDVIEETASKLVGKRVNKVRALAGAFETVISLQQPDSS